MPSRSEPLAEKVRSAVEQAARRSAPENGSVQRDAARRESWRLMEAVAALAAAEATTIAVIYRRAVREYVERHRPSGSDGEAAAAGG
jgi:hypothetical protein